jgi:Icc-related predicted phosphoesterase
MIRRFRLTWPDRRPFVGRDGRPIRFLAASDEADPALEHEVNRAALGPIDAVIGCGDLEPHWLSFLADAFNAPLVFVRGNHDRGVAWKARDTTMPVALGAGDAARLEGIAIAGLEWPGVRQPGNQRRDGLAWAHALRVALRVLGATLRGRTEPLLVISHVPPEGAGDSASDAYHVGFSAYRWLMNRLRPPLWLHGHTAIASVPSLETVVGRTTLVNVTGAVLVELVPPDVRTE